MHPLGRVLTPQILNSKLYRVTHPPLEQCQCSATPVPSSPISLQEDFHLETAIPATALSEGSIFPAWLEDKDYEMTLRERELHVKEAVRTISGFRIHEVNSLWIALVYAGVRKSEGIPESVEKARVLLTTLSNGYYHDVRAYAKMYLEILNTGRQATDWQKVAEVCRKNIKLPYAATTLGWIAENYFEKWGQATHEQAKLWAIYYYTLASAAMEGPYTVFDGEACDHLHRLGMRSFADTFGEKHLRKDLLEPSLSHASDIEKRRVLAKIDFALDFVTDEESSNREWLLNNAQKAFEELYHSTQYFEVKMLCKAYILALSGSGDFKEICDHLKSVACDKEIPISRKLLSIYYDRYFHGLGLTKKEGLKHAVYWLGMAKAGGVTVNDWELQYLIDKAKSD